jgi:two-component system NtrC family sensor kinase
LSYPFAYKGIDWGWIHLGLSTVKFHRDARALYWRSGLIAALAVSVGFVAALLHARRLSIPILELERFARKIASGDLSGRIEIRTGDELEQLAQSFNFMVAELQRSKYEREIAQQKLLDAARQAGMAEVAINVLHNVGNVLNSVGVTTSAVTKRMQQSKTASLASVAELVTSRGDNLAAYLRDDPSGRKLPEYLAALCAHLVEEQQDVLAHMLALEHHVQHMRDIIHLQQNYSRAIGFTEPVRIREVVEDALQLNAESSAQYGIAVIKQYDGAPVCLLDRHRLLQILTNLISNAHHALQPTPEGQRAITIRIGHARPDRLCIEVADTGHGISLENMTRIFQHGFTTRRNGHGFGLHGSAMAAKEMNGELTAHSEGPGHGATFKLILPCRNEEMTT